MNLKKCWEILNFKSLCSHRKRSKSDEGETELINISSDEEVLKNDAAPPQNPENGTQNGPLLTITSVKVEKPEIQSPQKVS